jgi:glycosyltransferase involved in cell wall biosynthesis
VSTAGLPVSSSAGVVRDYRFRQNRPVVHPDSAPDLTVVVPVYNEQESLPELVEGLFAVLDRLDCRSEVILVDDGSSDDSFAVLKRESLLRPGLRVIRFRRNSGQAAALMAGIDHAGGEVIITLDADLQNDPADIPILLSTLEQGYDVVSGWRKDRQDAVISRNFMSRIANRVISRISGVPLHDYGCTLKAYRREVLEGMRLYGEMHRFVPIYATWMGAKVTEIPVRHHARKFGKSNYGLERTLKVVLDLMVVKFLSRYLVKPIYVFGGFAAACFSVSTLAFIYMLYLKFVAGVSMIQTPLPVLIAMLILVGVMSIMMGLLAEILMRTYFESRGLPAYSVRERLNFDDG